MKRESILIILSLMLSVPMLGFAAESTEATVKNAYDLPVEDYSGRDGEADANRDFARGSARYYLYGRSAGLIYRGEWNQLSEERFRVRVEVIDGCFVKKDVVVYAESYNRRFLDLIRARFGQSAWTNCYDEAVKKWKFKKSLDTLKKVPGE